MDLFYKPPLQRHDECEALEENYMNCLLQKAMRDRVFNNRCVMDSILWFHLECPKNASKFDDPIEFKRKFRDFFAQTRTAAQNITSQSESARRIRDEYEHFAYPEDVREHKEYRLFRDTFEKYSPVAHPESEDDWETEDLAPWENIDKKKAEIGKTPSWEVTRPITREEDLKRKPAAK